MAVSSGEAFDLAYSIGVGVVIHDVFSFSSTRVGKKQGTAVKRHISSIAGGQGQGKSRLSVGGLACLDPPP